MNKESELFRARIATAIDSGIKDFSGNSVERACTVMNLASRVQHELAKIAVHPGQVDFRINEIERAINKVISSETLDITFPYEGLIDPETQELSMVATQSARERHPKKRDLLASLFAGEMIDAKLMAYETLVTNLKLAAAHSVECAQVLQSIKDFTDDGNDDYTD